VVDELPMRTENGLKVFSIFLLPQWLHFNSFFSDVTPTNSSDWAPQSLHLNVYMGIWNSFS